MTPEKTMSIDPALQLRTLYQMNRGYMGETDAYRTACESLGVDQEEGWGILAELAEIEAHEQGLDR